jgi:hypothetical protein
MIPSLNDSSFRALTHRLCRFNPREAVAAIAGLLTVPECATATIRLETLANLAYLHCRGTCSPAIGDLRKWVDRSLGAHRIASLEDPLEDVFVSAIATPGGVYRIFEGTWELNDANLQDTIDCIAALEAGAPRWSLVRQVRALLTLSETVCARRNLPRWLVPTATQPRRSVLASEIALEPLIRAVTFSPEDLRELGITSRDIAPFVAQSLDSISPNISDPPLERCPLVRVDDTLILACPAAVSPAIRMYVLEWAAERGVLAAYGKAVRQQQTGRLLNVIRAEGGGTAVRLPSSLPPNLPAELGIDEAVVAFDADKLAHIVILHDNFDDIVGHRVGELAPFSEAQGEALIAHLVATARAIVPFSHGGGLTIVALGGLGRGRLIELPALPGSWRIVADGVHDLITLLRDPEWDLLRLWRLLWHEERLATEGLELVNPSGLLNLAAYAQQHGHSLVPEYVAFPPPAQMRVIIGTDFVRDVRATRRREDDIHAVPLDGTGRSVVVRRLTARAFFPAMRERPIYAAESVGGHDKLVGLVEASPTTCWVTTSGRSRTDWVREFQYRLWEATLEWLDRLLALAAPHASPEATPFRVSLRLRNRAAWQDVEQYPQRPEPELPSSRVDIRRRAILVDVPPGFLGLVARATNDAERALVLQIAKHLPVLIGRPSEHVWPDSAILVDRCFSGPHARKLHAFQPTSPTDMLTHPRKPDPLLIPPDDRAMWELGLGWRVVAQPRAPDPHHEVIIDDSSAAVELLCRLVDAVWQELRTILAAFDRQSAIVAALRNLEEVERERQWWRRTARALTNLPTLGSDAAVVAAERERERSVANAASRVLVEMAACACAPHGGQPVGRGTLGTLLAGIAMLLELATHAETLKGTATRPNMRIRPNGFIDIPQPWLEQIAVPFVNATRDDDWQDAIAAYEQHLIVDQTPAFESAPRSSEPVDHTSVYDEPTFVEAFRAEYGMTPRQLIDIAAECLDWSIERGRGVFVVHRTELVERLRLSKGMPSTDLDTALSAFALSPRLDWSKAPPGFSDYDWRPWHFRRRLSLLARPIVLLDDQNGRRSDEAATDRIVISTSQIASSLSYLLSGLHGGWFQQAFVSSRAMRSYLGDAARQWGASFTQAVAARCRAAGWEVRTNVGMRHIGAGKELGKALGDVDVLAWKPSDQRVLCIECKRLRPARNVAEIMEVLARFRGDSKDLLARHVARVRWISEHLFEVGRGVGTNFDDATIVPLLVTNVTVPMQFVPELPVPPESIVPLAQLDRILQ